MDDIDHSKDLESISPTVRKFFEDGELLWDFEELNHQINFSKFS